MFLLAVASNWRDVTNGPDGMGVTRPDLYLPGLGILSLAGINSFYYFTLVLVGLGILACYLFLKTPLGNALICTHLVKSLPVANPANPPVSGPVLAMPHSPRFISMGIVSHILDQFDSLSPVQLMAYRCMPAQPEREMQTGRWSGRSIIRPSAVARAICIP